MDPYHLESSPGPSLSARTIVASISRERVRTLLTGVLSRQVIRRKNPAKEQIENIFMRT
jgi:hypothetical protein